MERLANRKRTQNNKSSGEVSDQFSSHFSSKHEINLKNKAKSFRENTGLKIQKVKQGKVI